MNQSGPTWPEGRGRRASGLAKGVDARGVAAPAKGRVVIVCAGGLENGGGIGRQVGYALPALVGQTSGIDYSVIDSRGPWFLGGSPIHTVSAVAYLAFALTKLTVLRFAAGRCIAHVNVTGRGSTLRKIIVCAYFRAIGMPYLLHVHDYDYMADFRRGRVAKQHMVRRLFQSAEVVLVLGHRDRRRMIEGLGLDADKVVVMHNAVPDPIGDRPVASRPGGTIELAFLGHLSDRKGVPELLGALAKAELAGLDWHLTLAGGGDIQHYRTIAANLGIVSRLTFAGWLDRHGADELFRRTDILVLPSHAEGMAMAVLEGLSYGLAVVATPVGAHDEVFDDGQSGLHVPPGDVDALASALRRLMTEQSLRVSLGHNARRTFLDKFEVDNYAARLGQIHAAALAEPGTRDR